MDLNPPPVRDMLLDNSAAGAEGTKGRSPSESLVHGVPESCLRYIKRVKNCLSPRSVSLLRLWPFSSVVVCCYPLRGEAEVSFSLEQRGFGQCLKPINCHFGLSGSDRQSTR